MVSRVGRINSLFEKHYGEIMAKPKFTLKDKPPNITFGGYFVLKTGGEGGIRTLDTFDSIPVFETGAFVRSATSPRRRLEYMCSVLFSSYCKTMIDIGALIFIVEN